MKPASQVVPIVPAGGASSAPVAAAPMLPAPGDETLFEGASRRWQQLVVDLKNPAERQVWAVIAGLSVLLLYSYGPGLARASSAWNDAQYSHGWMVPLFSLGLLFWWRKPVGEVTPSAQWAGLGILLLSFLLRLACAKFRIVTIDMYTFVPALAGLFLLVGGWDVFRWAWAPIGFLLFMYPLPDEATRYLLGPLQSLATIVSTFALQTLGLDAYREGNQIILGEMHLGVVDACSGLRMLTIFIALSVALVLLGDRVWWENVVILASAIPIALIVNSVRITVTGVLYQVASSEIAEMVFHDLAGWFMMPMALGMLFLEQYLLSRLFLADDSAPAVLAAPTGRGERPAEPPRPIAGFPALQRAESGKKMG